ncbi:MAG: squalene/phytoene synthase family protein [Chloroflexota bacterium]|nr:squalene/phytoene synthase family protein [Chloroflexota bacterium]
MIQQYDMLRAVSRTFALSIEQLPEVLRDSITVAYLLLRVSDILEDNEQMERPEKAELLRLWARVLNGSEPVHALTCRLSSLDGTDPEVEVAQKADGVLAQLQRLPEEIQGHIRRYVTQTSLGMARWQEQGPFVDDENELDDYMHHVAGIVGYLLTEIFAWYSPAIRERKDELMPLSREYGLALQTVNVLRGLRKDWERGWVFVPRTFCERVGLSPAELFDPRNLDRAMQVVELLADKAERHLVHGMTYITAFPRREHRIRLACMWPLFFAAKTLAVCRNDTAVLLAESKIGRDQVKKIMRDTWCFGWSNHWLRWYYGYLADPQLPAKAG